MYLLSAQLLDRFDSEEVEHDIDWAMKADEIESADLEDEYNEGVNV